MGTFTGTPLDFASTRDPGSHSPMPVGNFDSALDYSTKPADDWLGTSEFTDQGFGRWIDL